MPEFFINYLGKIKLDFKFPQSSQISLKEKSPSHIIEFLCNSYEHLIETPLSEDHLSSLLTSLLLLKDYTSCILLFKATNSSNPITLYNISLATIYSNDYKLGLYLIQCASAPDPSYLLLEVYLQYLLHNDTKALDLFSLYQKQQISHKETVLIKAKRPIFKPVIRKTPVRLKIVTNPSHDRLKTMDFTTVSTCPSNILIKRKKFPSCQVFKKTLPAPLKLLKKPTSKSTTPILSQNSISKLSLPDPLISKYSQSSLLDIPKLSSPLDSGLRTLSKNSIRKIITHFTTDNKNINQVFSLVSRLKFFQQYSQEICLNLLKCASYQFFKQDEIIFIEGNFADRFYVILQGSVSIQQEYKGLNIYLNSRYDGDTIGEYAIARGNIEKSAAMRSATCVASESLHTLCFSSKDYNEIMNKSVDNESIVINFLKTLRLFEHIPKIDLAYMANCIHPKHYSFEKEILPIGSTPKGLYLIITGRVRAIYKHREVSFPPKYFFGQRALIGETKPITCQVLSDDVDTTIVLIEPSHIALIYKPNREITLSLLSKTLNQDL